ncbi:MAG: rRNA pseudouridine synthase [Lachnospiraceae bacterium]|nr:rRNA pseudouridine synthase [Lachnospiraceae bacterium]
MRLDKFLANAGIGTRSEVKTEIKKKHITVNDCIIHDPGTAVSDKDVVCYKGIPVGAKKPQYFMMNKPSGCVSATQDEGRTVLDYLKPEDRRDVFPVGRLDKDTEGLLLLTDDGMFAHNLMSPRKHVDKTYYFDGEGILEPHAVKQMAEGIDIGDEKLTKPATLSIISEDIATRKVSGTLTISEGRYHQVKRMLAKTGVTVVYLKRISIGDVRLDETLAKGQYRSLTEEELHLLSKGRSNK